MPKSLLEVKPEKKSMLDRDFCPIIMGNMNYSASLGTKGHASKVKAALLRSDGAVHVKEYLVHSPGSKYNDETLRYLERQIKCLIWVYGGSKVLLAGPEIFCEHLKYSFSKTGARNYEAERMETIYDTPFEAVITDERSIPVGKNVELQLGGHLDGCRIGFDLGASDYKISSVIEGEPVFTAEIPWNPSVQADPEYHYRHISKGLNMAAAHLPKVDAIGGSAAGAYIDNRVKYASLFRSIPKKEFDEKISSLFLNLKREWGVPLEVLNDGEVTALAGSLSLKKKSLLGIAMGSSEASGFINARGLFTGNYNELSYVNIDYNPFAASDPVSKDSGCGSQYFSQQAVNRLAIEAGYEFPQQMLLPERLKKVQAHAEKGEERALEVFKTIGIYLGYTLPYYKEIFDFENVLILGRVTSGAGGEVIMETTKNILKTEFPKLSERISIFVPDEKSRRVGQAVAAASLPKIID